MPRTKTGAVTTTPDPARPLLTIPEVAGRLRVSVKSVRRLAEVPLAPCEAPPLDPGDEGVSYGFRAGERVLSDHPAVEACPGAFIEEDELGPPSAAR